MSLSLTLRPMMASHSHHEVNGQGPAAALGDLDPSSPAADRGMDCPKAKMSEAAVTCPSDDALEEILSRLSVKPLFRCKCVSKAWRSLITDRPRLKFPQTLLGFFYGGGGGEKYGHFTDLLGNPVPPVDVDHSFSFLTRQAGIKYIFLLDSCNGLLLSGHREDPDSPVDSLGFIVCNPSNEQWVAVPSSGWPAGSEAFEHDCSCTFLIFDPAASSEFKLLQLWHCMGDAGVRTYSSGSGVWSCKASEWMHLVTRYDAGSAFVNGVLHFVVPCINYDKDQILVMDVEGKTQNIIQVPEDGGLLAFVGLSQGHLHCIKGHMGEMMTELSIWALEDYEAGEWVLKHTVSILELFGRMSCKIRFDFTAVAIHPHCNLVFFVQHWDKKLISYDMDRKEVSALCALGDNKDVRVLCTLGNGYRSITPYVPYLAWLLPLARKL